MSIDRRAFLQNATAAAAAVTLPPFMRTQQSDLAPVYAQIERRHDESVQRLQEWIRQPSIAAENRGMNEGCDLTMRMLRDAGFQQVTKIPSDGQPGIFATLDAGAPKTLGLYFMYDVKQVDPAECSSPKVKKRSARRTSRRSCGGPRCSRRCKNRPASSCRPRRRGSTARSRSPSAPKA